MKTLCCLLAVLTMAGAGVAAVELREEIVPASMIWDEPEPIGKSIERAALEYRLLSGWSGEMRAKATIGVDGELVVKVRPVQFVSPFTACGDAKDCVKQIEVDCKEEGCTVKAGTTSFEEGVKCAASCSCPEGAVYVYHACPAPPVTPHPVRPEPQP